MKKVCILFCMFIFCILLWHNANAACNVSASSSASTNVTNIQNCINGFGSSGGTVNLSSGTFEVNGQIDLKSNITIQGQGSGSTIIKWTKDVSSTNYVFGRSYSSSSGRVHDVTIKNLKINGQNKDVMGVYLDGTGTYRFYRITVRDAIINNCGQYGIHMKQTDGIFIRDVDLDGNGKYTGDSGRSTRNHGIYFRDTTDVFIEYVTSNNSAANGINVSNSEDILISETYANSNGQHGMRSEANNGFRIRNSHTNNNAENGIEIHPEGSTYNDDICVESTTSQSNLNYGLYLTFTNDYELSSNTISGNTAGDTVKVAISTASASGICSSVPSSTSAWPFTR